MRSAKLPSRPDVQDFPEYPRDNSLYEYRHKLKWAGDSQRKDERAIAAVGTECEGGCHLKDVNEPH